MTLPILVAGKALFQWVSMSILYCSISSSPNLLRWLWRLVAPTSQVGRTQLLLLHPFSLWFRRSIQQPKSYAISPPIQSSRHAIWVAYLKQFTFTIGRKSGKLNCVADTRSRRHGLLTTLHSAVTGFTVFSDLYVSDPFFENFWVDACLSKHLRQLYSCGQFSFLRNSTLSPRQQPTLTLPMSYIRRVTFAEIDVLQLALASYFCPNILRDVECYVECCKACQLAKGHASNAGSYLPMQVPTQP